MYKTYSRPHPQFTHHKSWPWSETNLLSTGRLRQLPHPPPHFHYLQMSFKNVDYIPAWLDSPSLPPVISYGKLSAGTAYKLQNIVRSSVPFRPPFCLSPVSHPRQTQQLSLCVAFPLSSSQQSQQLLSVLWAEAASLCPSLRDTYLDSSWPRLPVPNPESHPVHDPLLLLTSNLTFRLGCVPNWNLFSILPSLQSTVSARSWPVSTYLLCLQHLEYPISFPKRFTE